MREAREPTRVAGAGDGEAARGREKVTEDVEGSGVAVEVDARGLIVRDEDDRKNEVEGRTAAARRWRG